MSVGHINYVSKACDYAFIVEQGTAASHFVHVRDMENRKIPSIGTEVTFETIKRDGRTRAVNCRPSGPAPIADRYEDL
jgi:cold shock CspA family protein